MTTECPNCKTPLPRQGSRFCNQCGFELRPALDAPSNPAENADAEDSIITDPMEVPGAAPAATLRIIVRDGSILERKIEKVETSLGKGTANDIILADPAVSTTHAMIRSEPRGYQISDLGSRNGTFVNDAQIEAPRQLHHGDVIKMGKCTLTFRLSQAGETAVLAPSAMQAIVQASAPSVRVTADAVVQAIVEAGVGDEAQVKEVLKESNGKHLVRTLIQKLKISDVTLRDLMSSKFGIPTADPSLLRLDQGIAAALSPAMIRQNLVFPAATGTPGHVTLVAADPTDDEIIAKVREKAKGEVEVRLASATEIRTALDQVYAPRLVGVMPNGEKLEVLITKPEIEIGKAPHNQVILTQPTVSNTHAVILARSGGYSVVDLGSSNGTFVNGERLGHEARTLQHGDKIQIAEALLTYRNPAETTENKTATLSPEILSEIRKRALMGVSVSSPAAAADGTDGTHESDEKGEKKPKKKKDDRIKAALIGSASRLVAQIIGGAVSIVGAIYVLSLTQGRTGPTNTDVGKQKLQDTSSFVSILGGKYEASGVTWVPETNTVLIADDGKPGQLLAMTLDENGKQLGPLTSIALNASIIDPEAITTDDIWYYVIGSQSDPASGAQNSLVRFEYDSTTKSIRGTPEVLPDFRSVLLSAVPELAAEGRKPGMLGGLNVEGFAFDRVNSRFLIGLRSPQSQGRALLVPFKLDNPRGPLTAANLKFSAPISLDLGGHGVRDIDYNRYLKSFLIISGAPEQQQKTDFGLWEWNGEADQANEVNAPRNEFSLDEDEKPEGLTNVTINGKQFVLIVGDASRYRKLDYAEKP